MDLLALPGGDLVSQGLADLAAGRDTVEAWLVRVGSPRLRRAGLEAPEDPGELPEHRLYALLAEQFGDGAHSRYNALIRRLVGFERALQCVRR